MQYLIKNGEGEDYNKRITDVTEKLHREAEKLRQKGVEDKIIIWEDFTSDYMKAGDSINALEQQLWKEKRSNMWKDDINERLAELGYQEALFVEYNIGVRLRCGNIAMWKMAIASIKKICSIATRRSSRLKLFSKNLTGIGAKKGESMANVSLSLIKQIYGEIGTNNTLTKREKKELLEEIESFIPDNSEE